ncbi:MFS transporter, partial [uncultured Sphaerotilus sp.]|uniref:MFS transporter n=1 Tax=uncultured Sphaerotilus sp. TaxID=474984 RepID=UPI0030CA13F3
LGLRRLRQPGLCFTGSATPQSKNFRARRTRRRCGLGYGRYRGGEYVPWGGAQFFTGRLSDRIGRHGLNVAGMWLCGAGVALLPMGHGAWWWSTSAAVAGLGMAMLYPNLSAAVADIAHPTWRASAIGLYRFWRDLGYGLGALGLGAAAALGGRIETAFSFVAVAMFLSGAVLWRWGEETHPRLNPAPVVLED